MTLLTTYILGRSFLPLLSLACMLAGTCCVAQQVYVGKYDAYVGFSDINAPFVNDLNQPGVGVQGGMALSRWISGGVDYSVETGSGPLTPSLMTKSLQMGLASELPPGYKFRVPTDVKIQTFGAGTILTWRRFPAATIILHPTLTGIRVNVTPHPRDPVATAVIHALLPSGVKRDMACGYGFGGGTDLRVTKHVSARLMFDAAWSHPIDDILGNGGWLYRFSIGPSFHFGRNINKTMK